MTEKRKFDVSVITTGGVPESGLPYVARVTRGADLRGVLLASIDDEQHAKDLELLRKIISYKHLSVLEFSNILYQIECPIYIARQLMRYRCSSFLERSLRVRGPMEGDAVLDDYKNAIESGVRREDARALLPLSTRTRFLWLLNLRELLHIADERLTPAAQSMTREIVHTMVDLAGYSFPHVIEYWQSDRVFGYWKGAPVVGHWKEYRKDTNCPTK